jgi:hypothetical protein
MSPRPPLLLACALVGCVTALLLLQFTSPLLAVEAVSAAATPTPGAVVVNSDGTMTVDGAPFKIKGVGQCAGVNAPLRARREQWDMQDSFMLVALDPHVTLYDVLQRTLSCPSMSLSALGQQIQLEKPGSRVGFKCPVADVSRLLLFFVLYFSVAPPAARWATTSRPIMLTCGCVISLV